MRKSSKKNKTDEEILDAEDEENQYRKQIMQSHGKLGKDIVPLYDTGREK